MKQIAETLILSKFIFGLQKFPLVKTFIVVFYRFIHNYILSYYLKKYMKELEKIGS